MAAYSRPLLPLQTAGVTWQKAHPVLGVQQCGLLGDRWCLLHTCAAHTIWKSHLGLSPDGSPAPAPARHELPRLKLYTMISPSERACPLRTCPLSAVFQCPAVLLWMGAPPGCQTCPVRQQGLHLQPCGPPAAPWAAQLAVTCRRRWPPCCRTGAATPAAPPVATHVLRPQAWRGSGPGW